MISSSCSRPGNGIASDVDDLFGPRADKERKRINSRSVALRSALSEPERAELLQARRDRLNLLLKAEKQARHLVAKIQNLVHEISVQ